VEELDEAAQEKQKAAIREGSGGDDASSPSCYYP
jgi:hypothetical protein